MMMTGGRYGDAQSWVQSLGSEQTLAVQQTIVLGMRMDPATIQRLPW